MYFYINYKMELYHNTMEINISKVHSQNSHITLHLNIHLKHVQVNKILYKQLIKLCPIMKDNL